MTTFGWKRKIGDRVTKGTSAAFENDTKEDDDPEICDVDWLTLVPQRKVVCLEDALAKSHRLKQEGTALTNSERYWEAIRKWDEAIKLNPTDETLYEMKSQVLQILCEVYPAVTVAEKAVELKPTWWVAHQTLGRAQLGMGEVRLALKSFSRAFHLNPADKELWKEDLQWASELWQNRLKTLKELESKAEEVANVVIEEITEDVENVTEKTKENTSNTSKNNSRNMFTHTGTSKLKSCNTNVQTKPTPVPRNYVHMRDS